MCWSPIHGRTKGAFSRFSELVPLLCCTGEAGEDLQQDALAIKGKDAHPGAGRRAGIVLKGRAVVAVKQKMTEHDLQKCRKRFMRHDLQNITTLVYSSKPTAFLREKSECGSGKYHLEDHPTAGWCEMSRRAFCQNPPFAQFEVRLSRDVIDDVSSKAMQTPEATCSVAAVSELGSVCYPQLTGRGLGPGRAAPCLTHQSSKHGAQTPGSCGHRTP